ncbi:MAG: chorismate mutase [Acidobacteria bacterium]|nr:MAG: chorismate mutase [Acidobacteriota bacterium]PYQ24056.1 MAG: chorismate mutase [Acidobacteriota bacterium]
MAQKRDLKATAAPPAAPPSKSAEAAIDAKRRPAADAPEGRASAAPRGDSLPAGEDEREASDRGRERPATPRDLADIDAWRRRIDAIDEQLMRLLNSRSACAVEIGKVKRALGLPVYSPEREAWILERVMRENPGPLDPTAVRRVFERIIDESRRLERMAVDKEGPAPKKE